MIRMINKAESLLPVSLAHRVRRLRRPARLGSLRRTTPLSTGWGYDRGTPVDRYYIDQFLNQYRHDIRGRVLEIKDSGYTDRFGVGVMRRDVLDIDRSNQHATMIVDLRTADAIAANQFDCFILTQTLQFFPDPRTIVQQAYRILRPGGVLLVTVPAVSRHERKLTDYWRFMPAACVSLFGDIFGSEHVTVHGYGNVLTAIAFLAGMAGEELSRHELETHDPAFPVLVGVRAIKGSAA